MKIYASIVLGRFSLHLLKQNYAITYVREGGVCNLPGAVPEVETNFGRDWEVRVDIWVRLEVSSLW